MPSAQLTNNLKRPADDASDVDRDDGTQTQPSTTPVHKLQRIDSSSGIAAADYANPNSIKKKSAGSSSRTGQACDRCKVNSPTSCHTPFTRRACLHITSHVTGMRTHTTLTLLPDPQDTMRRTTGWLLAMPPEQHRVQDDGSHYW